MARRRDLKALAEGLQLPLITIEDITTYVIQTGAAQLTTTRVSTYRPRMVSSR